jgi:monoamine oxidase
MSKQSIIIIGGGITGLVAARILSTAFQVTLLEALPRYGGRIHTIRANTDLETDLANQFPYIEAGAEFVHGTAEESLKLLAEAGIAVSDIAGEFYRKEGSELIKEEQQVEGWDQLMQEMAEVKGDISLQMLLDLSFAGPQHQALREQARAFAEGFDLADLKRASVKVLYDEWSHQSEDHRVDGGYGRLIDFLVDDLVQKGCTLINDAVVKEVNLSGDQLKVLLSSKAEFSADKCLVTVPIGVLHNNRQTMGLSFVPAIKPYEEAIGKIGFGTVIKVILQFKDVFWKTDAGFFFSGADIPTWWTQLPETSAQLTGWCGGPRGLELSALSDAEILHRALLSLAAIFNLPLRDIQQTLHQGFVFNWQQQATFAGAYSYATTETAAAMKLLQIPVADRLYFAGEGFYEGSHPGTVEAAIISAKRAAKKISR